MSESSARPPTNPLAEFRYEFKSVYDAHRSADLFHWIDTHRLGFRTAFPDRLVHSLYLDGYDLDAFEENLSGASQRRKVRLRWYDDRPEIAYLEAKERSNRLGRKQRYALPHGIDLGASYPVFMTQLRSQLDAAAALLVDGSPAWVLLNRYRRSYYLSHCRRVRVTVDQQVQIFDQRWHRRLNTRYATPCPAVIVLECKLDHAARDDQIAAALRLPGRLSRSSKYVWGTAALLGV